MKHKAFFLLSVILLIACKDSDNNQNSPKTGKETSTPTATKIDCKSEPIETYVLQGKNFYQELVGNGKVMASRSAELRFKTVERIAHVWVRNGDRVQAGQQLAELDKFRLEQSLAQAKNNLEQSRLDLQDVLIGRGYSLEEIESTLSTSPIHGKVVDTLDINKGNNKEIPQEEFALACVKSGYNKALIAYELAEEELEQAKLRAPFSGVVANLTAKAYNLSSTGEAFCLVIDDTQPEVSFSILESEFPMVQSGCNVAVIPFATDNPTDQVWGKIVEVNPYVESNGMVKVKARVSNNGRLIEGMNVKVTLRRLMGERLVIPKSAVVMRSGKPVVFTQSHGKAQWNYVQVLSENSDSCTVAPRTKEYEGLTVGDTVIVKGNLNLAHDMKI